MTRRAWILGLAAFFCVRTAMADEGTLVAIDSGDLVLDVGKKAGLERGQVVELWRPLKVKHPVTGKIVADRFKIATVKLTDVENVMSLGKVEQGSQRNPTPGDIVVLPDKVEKPAKGAPTPAPTAPAAPTPMYNPAKPDAKPQVILKTDPDAELLGELFDRLKGQDRVARVAAYRSFAAEHPQSRFDGVLSEEIVALQQEEKREDALKPASYAPINRLRLGTPQRFAVELDPRFVGAVVHVKAHGASSYRSIPMQPIGDRYWSATLPGDAIAEPSMDYFVEGTRENGTVYQVVGSADKPRDAPVDARPLSGKREGTLATLAVSSELASFNVKKANDYLFQTEGAFGWRLGDLGIRAVRSGFGVLRGKGGSLNDLEVLHKDPHDVGLTYGWLEAELGIVHGFSLIGRPILGLRQEGLTGGAQAFFRIGNDLETNLLIGGEALGSVGLRGAIELQWKTIPRVPILLRSEVTNQPAGVGGDVGARAIAQVGYEVVKDLAVSVRGSYQGRTINHAGPGGGAGVSYQW